LSYDVAALLTNVPPDETLNILADKAFKDNWFNKTYVMNISKEDFSDRTTNCYHKKKKKAISIFVAFVSFGAAITLY